MNKKPGDTASISRNLSVSLVLVLVVVIAVIVAARGIVISHNEKTALGRKAEALLANLQRSVALPIWNFDTEVLEKICDAYFLSDPVSELLITEGRGQDIIIRKADPGETDTIVREGEVLHQGEVIARIKIKLTKRHYRQRLEVKQEMVARVLEQGGLEKDLKFQVKGDNGLNYVAIAVAPLTTAEGKRGAVIRIHRDGDMGVVEIQDNGPGMDELVRKRVFEPFFTTKPIGIGTGLGLSVSYFIIVENHGGTLGVVSSRGRGARFIIHLPMKKPAKDSLCC